MDTATDTTHDTASASFRLPDFSTFLTHVTDATKAAWPEKLQTEYKKVKVLMMSWENDDLEVETEMKPLASVFQGLYQFDTEIWRIPLRRSGAELSRKIANVVRTEGQHGNLIIFYYGGHAKANEHVAGRPVWFANRSTNSPFVRSSLMHTELEKAACDILLLYDCPHAVQPGETFTGKGMIQTLAASPLDSSSATADTHHSFTPSLVQELAHAAHSSEPLSVVELHRRLISRQQTVAPKVYFTDDSYSIVQVNRQTGQPIVEPSRQRLPMHNLLTSSPIRTIVLSPLKTDTPTPLEQPLVLLSPPSPRPQSHVDASSTDGPEVLIACRLKDQNIDAEKWKNWLANAAEGAKGIKITAVYPSFSLLLLVKMPIAVWDMLPASPAMTFVGYTSGRDFSADLERVLGKGKEPVKENGRVMAKVGPSCNHEKEVGYGEQRGFDLRRAVKTSIWPDVFTQGRPEAYVFEQEPHCLRMSEIFADDESTQAQRIIREFVWNVEDDPAGKHIREEIQQFCEPASKDRQTQAEDKGSDDFMGIIVGEKMRGVQELKLLGQDQLLDALLPSTGNSKSLVRAGDSPAAYPTKQRLIYLNNLDSWTTLSIAAVASQTQSGFLKDFVHQYLTSQASIGVVVNADKTAFQLSFHLPILAWRTGTPTPDRRQLRKDTDLKSLADASDDHAHLYESQFSCMVTGVDDCFFTAYGFFDTYYDGTKSKHASHHFERSSTDPLLRTKSGVTSKTLPARDYFLHAMQSAVGDAKAEWTNSALAILKKLKAFNNESLSLSVETSHKTTLLSEQLQNGLASITHAWSRFQETDVAYFDLTSAETITVLSAIDKDIRDLHDLREALAQQTSLFRARAASHLALENERHKSATSRLMLITPVASSFIILAARFALLRLFLVVAVGACAVTAYSGKRQLTIADLGITPERAEVLKDYVRDFGTLNCDIKGHVRGVWDGAVARVAGGKRKVVVEEVKVLGVE
ncbi:hypothetical protein QBC34DRAFT_380855 [Podospora aff. communis PSN243]|uniref:Caspase family p20 domain-containing protein n=1 Tax=Podospora aff. communis PSN243 TaxID=3040156 RepID=A0AAV9GKX7_9PEZI|nr:hypothetical protein QBC34DRAFT_380855 [Podospora aff. communis PSN243]